MVVNALARLTVLAAAAVSAVFLPSAARAQMPADDVEVILTIDTSESMQPAIANAKAAANEFIAAMPPGVRIGVETFSDSVSVLAPPTTDRGLLNLQIALITTGGDTALYDGVVGASQRFSPDAAHKVLVVLSDGRDEGSAATLDDARLAATNLHVEAISLATALSDVESLTALGFVTPADDPAGVSAAFARVAGLVVEVIETAPTTAATPTTTIAPTTTAAPATTAAQEPTAVTATQTQQVPPTTPAIGSNDQAPSTVWLWVGAAGIFVGLFLMGALLFPRARVSKARLGIDKPRTASSMGVKTMSAVDEALERYGKRADLGETLAMADIAMQPAEFAATVAVVAIVAGFVGLVALGPIVGLIVAVLVCAGTAAWVRRARDRRRAAFADQLPDVLQLVTTALRSGYGITQALESVAEEAEEPARSEFANVLAESRLGRDLSESMHALAGRMDSKDLEWVVSAIDINRDTGGNLSEILQKVSMTIRERARIGRQVRTLTAEGRLSARILLVMPFAMLLWQWRVNPDNLAKLTEGVGLVFLAVAGILLVLGSLWVRRIVNSVAL
jgi:tight adherence protein B